MMLRSKTFLRYMLSYALVLFLPLLVLCTVFYFARWIALRRRSR